MLKGIHDDNRTPFVGNEKENGKENISVVDMTGIPELIVNAILPHSMCAQLRLDTEGGHRPPQCPDCVLLVVVVKI